MKKTRITPLLWIALALLPITVSLISLCIGRMPVTISDVLQSFGAKLFGTTPCAPLIESTIWRSRLPRILLALLGGAGLSVSGLVFQSLFANPLATPDTLGVASGASFGAALGILLGLPFLGVQFAALVMGLAALALTFLAGRNKRERGMTSIVLAGIMMSSLFSALVSFVKFTADTDDVLPAITYFLMGTLNGAGYDSLLLGAPPILLGLIVLYLLRFRLGLLPLGEEEAKAAGIRLRALRLVVMVCAALMTASCVSMCGQVGWVGLLVPHICRMIFGSDHRKLLPASILLGSAFLVAVDTAARSITAAELPISVLTAVLGAPFFILLMRKSGKSFF